MKPWLSAALVVVSFVGCGPVHSTLRPSASSLTGLQRVAVVLPYEGAFTVIRERAKATATPAVLFGVIGAVAASAHNQSLDSREAETLVPYLVGFSPRATLRQAFLTTMKASGRITELEVFDRELSGSQSGRYDAVITVRISGWGLRLPARAVSDQLAAFAELETKMVRTRDGQVLWQEHDVALGQGRYDLAHFREDVSLLRNELTETLESTGRRMANVLVYPKEAPK